MMRPLAAGVTLLTLALIAIALPWQPPAGTAAAATASVSVQDNKYVPSTITITTGDTVEWTWAGSNIHTVTSTGAESFDSGAPQSSGTFSHLFSAAGTFTYQCSVHGAAMSGTVIVQDATAPTDTAVPATSTSAPATSTPAATNTTAPTNTASASTSTPNDTPTPAVAAATAAAATQPASTRTPPATATRLAGGAVLPAAGDGGSARRGMPWAAIALAVTGFAAACTVTAVALHRLFSRT